jgi:hypothetical protein
MGGIFMKKRLKLLVTSMLVFLTFAFSQIHLSQAMEKTTPITLVQPDGRKMVIKVYLGKPLSDLRSELIARERILPDDIFLRDGHDIYKDEEKNWLIREVLIGNALSLKPRVTVVQQNALAGQQRIRQAEMRLTVPLVARGHEAVYQRFLKGVLIYRPQEGSNVGRIDLPIAALANPLEGTFDLSRCGDASKYLSISTGYRKGKRTENANKLEVWFAPRFLITHELKTTARHFQNIYGNWKESAEVGIFWTWGGWDNLDWYEYLTTKNMVNLSKNNLYKNWVVGTTFVARQGFDMWVVDRRNENFLVSFVN